MLEHLPEREEGLRFLFYSHDGLGLGHTQRNLAIASAVIQIAPDASVLMASGTDGVYNLGLAANVDVIKLPGVCKLANECYASRRLRVRRDDIFSVRSALLKAVVQSFKPNVLLADKHPLGAGGELHHALQVHRRQGGRTVLGLRDILDDGETVRQEWLQYDLHSCVSQYYDLLFIYGHAHVFDPIRCYSFPGEIAARTLFCGYVVRNQEQEIPRVPFLPPDLKRPVVVATCGGGESGYRMLKTFLQSARGAPWEPIAVAGPMMSESQRRKLQGVARNAGVSLHDFVPQMSCWFAQVDALVCLGGYNTLAESLFYNLPTVCVPRTFPRAEQRMRAAAFEKLGLLEMLEEEDLSATKLREAIQAALSRSRSELRRRIQSCLDFNGAARAADRILALACKKEPLSRLAIKTS